MSIASEGPCRTSIDFNTAQAILLSRCAPLGPETVSLERAGRRRLAAPVIARIDAPRFDAAAMDGYAVRSDEIAAGRRSFAFTQTCLAGDPQIGLVPHASCVRVMTGAPMPEGLDQVVVVERGIIEGTHVRLSVAETDKKHVRIRGSDFRRGTILLPAGREIDPRAMLVAAAGDVGQLTVWRSPRVTCLASGDELVAPGSSQCRPHSIPDSLSEALLLFCRQWGARPAGSARVGDDLTALTNTARDLLANSDVLVVVGGAAHGDRDFAKAGLAPLGLAIAFADVAIKPGKPVWYGRIGEKHVLGLPGNPTAALTIARLFLAPLLMALSGGSAASALRFRPRCLTRGLNSASDREQFLCGFAVEGKVEVIERQAASMQSTLADADLLLRIPAGSGALTAGTPVQTLRF